MSTSTPRLQLQASATDLARAIEHANGSGSGIVLTGKSEARGLRAVREANSDLQIVVDKGAWQEDVASPDRVFDGPADDGLFPMSLDDYVGALLDQGASRVLTPTFAIQKANWRPAIEAVLDAYEPYARPELLPFLAIQSSILDESNWAPLREALARFPIPLKLTILGARDSMAAENRIPVLRELIREQVVDGVYAAEPLIVTDALAHGIVEVAVGVSSSLRIPQMPGGHPSQTPGREPGLFNRSILEMRTPSVYADWFAGRLATQVCPKCGCALAIYRRSDHAKFVAHTLHETVDFVRDLVAESPEVRHRWLADERRSALARHPQALVLADVSRTLRRLVALDQNQPVPATTPR